MFNTGMISVGLSELTMKTISLFIYFGYKECIDETDELILKKIYILLSA